ncbi:hypothetical protein J4462_03705 [Candidatus Pacearchaeota archaeon]|nr:hypothetical protein [Candidatus Pacearchaeota archaeon]
MVKRKIMIAVDVVLSSLFTIGTIYFLYLKEFINVFFTLSMALLFWFSIYSHRKNENEKQRCNRRRV